jgi:hypothetical protein
MLERLTMPELVAGKGHRANLDRAMPCPEGPGGGPEQRGPTND